MSGKECACGKRTPEQTTCFHKYHVCDYWTCTRNADYTKKMYPEKQALSHKHDNWSFACSAWDTKQDPNHSGVGGKCAARKQCSTWDQAIVFYVQHRNREYCSITAQRLFWDDYEDQRFGGENHFTCYIRCTGCGLANAILRTPPNDSTCVT